MRWARTGVGSAFGAGFGLVFGQMLSDAWWLGPMIGVAAGLVIGAVADVLGPREALPRTASDEHET